MRVGVSTTSSPTTAWSKMGSSLLLPLPPRPLPPWPRPPATAGVFFFEFTDIAFPLLVGILNISGVSRLFSTSIWRQARHAVAFYRHSHLTAAVRWLCVERALHARAVRGPCALRARAIRPARQQHAVHALSTRQLLPNFDKSSTHDDALAIFFIFLCADRASRWCDWAFTLLE